jgi:hypothetical protein
MARSLQTVDQLQQYLTSVMSKAIHHGPNVNSVILTLAGAVVLYKDRGTQVQARTYRGSLANVLYVSIRRTR